MERLVTRRSIRYVLRQIVHSLRTFL